MEQSPSVVINKVDLTKITVFDSKAVKQLSTSDFTIDSDIKIGLRDKSCCLVLFYIENIESQQLVEIWASVARVVVGPVFAAVNLIYERKVAEAFAAVKSDGNNVVHWAGLKELPFIMVYRNGIPTAFYNGPRETQSIMDYSVTLACGSGYYEPLSIFGGVSADQRVEMGPVQTYTDIPGSPPTVKKTSLEYKIDAPIRNFNNKLSLAEVGSTGAQQETETIRQQEAAAAAAGNPNLLGSTTDLPAGAIGDKGGQLPGGTGPAANTGSISEKNG